LKAYRKQDGNILLFRPEENALRMRLGAERMCMPSPTVEQFVEAVKATVLANKHWVAYLVNLAVKLFLLVIGRKCQIGKSLMFHFRFHLQVKVPCTSGH
jgi:branched-subunit amino acid aminotransferase/4-amino-4-deoxychorismate lyase